MSSKFIHDIHLIIAAINNHIYVDLFTNEYSTPSKIVDINVHAITVLITKNNTNL